MCHHTREATVLLRVSCRPAHLNIDRFHLPCLLPGRTSRIGAACRLTVPRGDHLPLRAAWFVLLCASLEVFDTWCQTVPRQDVNSPFLRCMCHPGQERCLHTNAGSGPSRVRRRPLQKRVGDPLSLVICCLSSASL